MCKNKKIFQCIVNGIKYLISGENLMEAEKNCVRKYKSHGKNFREIKEIEYVRMHIHQ